MPGIIDLANSVLTLAAFAQEKGLINGADALLVPLNPKKLPAFSVMTGLLEDQSISAGHLQWVQNIESSLEYASNSHNASHYNARLAKLGFDNLIVNAAAELPADIGIPFAADYANQAAATYAQKIVEDMTSRSMETTMSMNLRMRGPSSKQLMNETMKKPFSYFGGTGVFGEDFRNFGFGNAAPKRNPLHRGYTPSGKKRPIWTYKFRGGGITQNTTNTITFVYKVGKLGSRLKLKLPIVKSFEKYSFVFLVFLYLSYCWTLCNLILKYGPELSKFLSLFYKNFSFQKEIIQKYIKKSWKAVRFKSLQWWYCTRYLLYLDG